MADHLEFGAGLTKADYDQPFRDTFLGQAHIAGTGPAGATCRECKFWRVMGRDGPAIPGHYSRTNKDKAGQLKKAKCIFPIPHKANRMFPHSAKACRMFEQSETVPPLNAPQKRDTQ
ncbi:hypothetical protein [Novosphingobium olei]|uniref:Uncharacterized protein n=1 Tax=Novosphingobium olei TaxID=2728851 RepID=A0A7Y0BP41_9SPHN|nr:hypothetical protein [Novosphingobium olei]NML93763.1 hypothetical protein [Novosphingobium olei]